jgi:hypothetical protein
MPILGGIVLFIQFCFAYHAMKTGRPYWWLFVIMGFPVMGCIMYYFIEIFPTTRESRSAEKAVRNIARSFNPDKGLRDRVADLDSCGSVANRIALAQECMSRGMYDEAEALYRSCLTGVHENDPDIIIGLANALAWKRSYAAVLPELQKLMERHAKFRVADVRMLLGEALEGTGELDKALAEFRVLADTWPGEEGRWRYGALLKRMGRNDEALEVFEGMLKRAQRMPRQYRDAQKEWLDLAAENSRQ